MGRGIFRDNRESIWYAVWKLVGHLLAASVIFVAFFLLVWLVSYALSYLQAVHPFPTDIFNLITTGEVWLTYADWGLCIVVLFSGAMTFVRDLWRQHL